MGKGDFQGGAVDRNLSANGGDSGSIPGLRRFHMPWGNSAHVPQLLKPVCPRACDLKQEKPPQREIYALQLGSGPHSLQLEKSPCSNKDPAQPNK